MAGPSMTVLDFAKPRRRKTNNDHPQIPATRGIAKNNETTRTMLLFRRLVSALLMHGYHPSFNSTQPLFHASCNGHAINVTDYVLGDTKFQDLIRKVIDDPRPYLNSPLGQHGSWFSAKKIDQICRDARHLRKADLPFDSTGGYPTMVKDWENLPVSRGLLYMGVASDLQRFLRCRVNSFLDQYWPKHPQPSIDERGTRYWTFENIKDAVERATNYYHFSIEPSLFGVLEDRFPIFVNIDQITLVNLRESVYYGPPPPTDFDKELIKQADLATAAVATQTAPVSVAADPPQEVTTLPSDQLETQTWLDLLAGAVDPPEYHQHPQEGVYSCNRDWEDWSEVL